MDHLPMRYIALALAACLPLCLFALPAAAQSRAMVDKLDRLERDVQFLQRQVSRGGGDLTALGDADSASLGVRLDAMDEEIRGLRGRVEENAFQLRKVKDDFAKYREDTTMRLDGLRDAQDAQAQSTQAITPPPSTGSDAELVDEYADDAPEDGAEVVDNAPPSKAASEPDQTSFDTARDHYNYAFRLLNQTQYEAAAASFQAFADAYPDDALIGNAYYWLGESHYIRRDYIQAADNFRQGFEALPAGPKAADNLLKLAMSLSSLKKTKEACVVLDRVATKYKDKAKSTALKAQSERERIGCQ